jgi:hypothetical protein
MNLHFAFLAGVLVGAVGTTVGFIVGIALSPR